MSESNDTAAELPPPAPASANATAGAMLRAAREKQGLHIAALAASIKVTPRKLEALEADRFDELPDLTFARALAQTVCRTLKVDPAPVLAALPQPATAGTRLEQVAEGMRAPFRDRPGRPQHVESTLLNRPAFWAPTIVLLCAVILYLLPESSLEWLTGAPAPAASAPAAMAAASATAAVAVADVASAPTGLAEAASAGVGGASAAVAAAASAVFAAASVAIDTVHSAPPPGAAAASVPGRTVTPAGTPGPASALVLRASAESWIEVRDGGGAVLLSRALQAGESVTIEGALPLRATIGNAVGTTASFRGQPLDLAAMTRDNVVRLELK